MSEIKDFIVLDLDDTLYAEIDFLKSAYKFIADNIDSNNEVLYSLMLEMYFSQDDVFGFLASTYNIDKSILLKLYRNHKPDISLYPGVEVFLKKYHRKYGFSLVTDGRSTTQRNKIEALNIQPFLENIVISEEIGTEKPNCKNFKQAISGYESRRNYYIGDNIKKDFITPNKMGWVTICLEDKGNNIHKQITSLEGEYLPHYYFKSWLAIDSFFNSLHQTS